MTRHTQAYLDAMAESAKSKNPDAKKYPLTMGKFMDKLMQPGGVKIVQVGNEQ